MDIRRLRMIMLCASLAFIIETILELFVGIKQSGISIVIIAVHLAIVLTFYKPELKELIDKIMGNNDDDFRGGNFG